MLKTIVITGLALLPTTLYGDTVLIDVQDGKHLDTAVATAADFKRADNSIADTDVVFALPEGKFGGDKIGGQNAGGLSGTGVLAGVHVESEDNTGKAFKTSVGHFAEDAILSDYRYRADGQVGTVTLGGFDQVKAGDNLKFVFWGVGDKATSNTRVTFTYNDVTQTADTDFDAGTVEGAVAEFNFIKVEGVNDITFTFQKPVDDSGGAAGWGGLSITVSAAP